MIRATSSKVRLAVLIRVSTPKQEAEGESLRVQLDEAHQDAKYLNATIHDIYGGQERATPDFDHAEVKRLITDAEKRPRPFDAVWIPKDDRWSRDNNFSSEGLTRLCDAGVRYFYVRKRKLDLLDARDRHWLETNVLNAQYTAQLRRLESVKARISRAETDNAPTCGSFPRGRKWRNGVWKRSKSTRELMERCAKRYLSGEGIQKIAASEGVKHRWLHKMLTTRCGPVWTQTFYGVKVESDGDVVLMKGESHTVETKIPALLDAETIDAIHQRAASNRKRYCQRGSNRYLLSGMIYCGHCHHCLASQVVKGGRGRTQNLLYYRHLSPKKQMGPCSCKRHTYVSTKLDDLVLDRLFKTLGNPIKLRKAITQAIPNPNKVEEMRTELIRLESESDGIDKSRDLLIDLVERGKIAQAKADQRFDKLNQREATIETEITQLRKQLANVVTSEEVEKAVAAHHQYADAIDQFVALHSEPKTWKERRGLCELAFAGQSDGKRNGVYIHWKGDRWTFKICGRLWLDRADVLNCTPC